MTNHDARFGLLYELGCAFAAQMDLEQLSLLVLSKCREIFHARAASILLLDPQKHELYFPYVAETSPEMTARLHSLRFPANKGIAGAVLQSGRPLRIDDVSVDQRFHGDIDRITGLTTHNLLCAPLRSPHGTIGVIQVLNRELSFTDHDLAFLDALAGSVAVAIENARLYAQLKQQVAALERAINEHEQLLAIRHELDIARRIQQSILPRTFLEREDCEIFAAMLPANEVGGDFYDFFMIDDHRLCFSIGDVSGKGVPAALFMAMTKTMLKSRAASDPSPASIVTHVNDTISADNDKCMFVTLYVGILDLRNGTLLATSAGHNPPLLKRHGEQFEWLNAQDGPFVGPFPCVAFNERTTQLKAGDELFFYTDGVTEADNVQRDLFGGDRLKAVLDHSTSASMAERIGDVMHAVKEFAAGAPQSDDITMLVLRFRGGPADSTGAFQGEMTSNSQP